MRSPTPLHRALLVAALCLPASAQWNRTVFSGKGEFRDVPSPHPLNYFTAIGATEINWKSILVRVGPNRYKEIFQLQEAGTTRPIEPSSIVSSGGERVLTTMNSDGGN